MEIPNDEFVRPAERTREKKRKEKGLRFFFQRRNKYILESGGRKIVALFPVHSLVKDDDELNILSADESIGKPPTNTVVFQGVDVDRRIPLR